MGRGLTTREHWIRFAFAYCRGTENKVGYAAYAMMEIALLWMVLYRIARIVGDTADLQETVLAACVMIVMVQVSYFSIIRHSAGYVFHLAKRASLESHRGFSPTGAERLELFGLHLDSIRRFVNWRAVGASEDLLGIELKRQKIPGAEKLDFDALWLAMRLDMLHQYTGLGEQQIHLAFKKYYDTLLDSVEQDKPTVRSWIEFLTGYYGKIAEDIRQTAFGDYVPEALQPEKTLWERLELAAKLLGATAACLYAISQLID